jgi:hypothetical protein
VFDPLAISLIIAANNAFNKAKQPEKLVVYDEKSIIVEKPIEPPAVSPINTTWYNYVPPVFKRKKEDDDIKTY